MRERRPRAHPPATAALRALTALVTALVVVGGALGGARAVHAQDEPVPLPPGLEDLLPEADRAPSDREVGGQLGDPGTSVPTPPNVGGASPTAPTPVQEDLEGGADATIGLEVPDVVGESSNAVVIILLLTVLSIAPSILVLTTSFTRIVIVMSLTRNALGVPQIPPQQVVVGLSLFLTLFVMGPTLSEMNEVALQPLLAGDVAIMDAAEAASEPLREFMLLHTREAELEMFLDAAQVETPVARDAVPLNALIPAFVLSELKTAFIIGFVVFVPFMVIDLVVSAVLTSLGMMMLPPTFVSLPFKILLFVLLDGWTLIIGTLLTSYR